MSVFGWESNPSKTGGDKWVDATAAEIFTAVYAGCPDASPLAIKCMWRRGFGGGVVVQGAILGASSLAELHVNGRELISVINSCGRGVSLGKEPIWSSLANRFDDQRFAEALAGGKPAVKTGNVEGVRFSVTFGVRPWQEGVLMPRAPLTAACFGWNFGKGEKVKSEIRDNLVMDKDQPYTLTDCFPTNGGCRMNNYHCYPPPFGGVVVCDIVEFGWHSFSN